MRKTFIFLTLIVAVIAMGVMTAGTAAANIATFNKITPDMTSPASTVTGVGTDHVVYDGGGWSSGLTMKWWDPVSGPDGDYSPLTGEKYGFAGGSFTVSQNATVTMKVTAFNSGALDATEIYLYQGTTFDRLNPNTNKVVSGDGQAGIIQALQAGTTYWLIVTTDAPFIPGSGSGIVTADITATAVPIPGAVWLLGSGLVGLVGIRRRMKK